MSRIVFDVGATFPTSEIIERDIKIAEDTKLYEGKQSEVYLPALLKRLEMTGVRHTRGSEYISYSSGKLYNMYSKITQAVNVLAPICDLYSDLIFGEGLKITDNDEEKNIWLNEKDEGWIDREDVISKLQLAQSENGYKGNAVLKVWEDLNGNARLSIIPAEYWIPITSLEDSNIIEKHAIVIKVPIDDNKSILRVVEYEKGTNTYKSFLLKDGQIMSYIKWDEKLLGKLPTNVKMEQEGLYVEKTNLSYSMIQVVKYKNKSNSAFGRSIATKTFKENEREIFIRATQRGRILDKNADPGMEGGALSDYDENGNEIIRVSGNYITRNSTEDPETKYITWEGKLDENREAERIALEYIYTETGTNGAILSATTEGIATISGTALEKVLMRPLSVSKKHKTNWLPVIKRIIKLAYEIEKNDTISPDIIFYDGLPSSKLDDITILKAENGNNPVISQKTSIRRANPSYTVEQVEKEYQEILQEQKDREGEVVMNTNDIIFGE